jgi:uncharacterized damage-inducible protein DinB
VASSARPEPPTTGGERVSLTEFLEYQRETLAWKCAGLSPGQLREQAVPPSGLSLLGLVRHLTAVERSWFRSLFSGEAGVTPVWESDPRAAFAVQTADPDTAVQAWREECARSRAIVAAAGSLDEVGTYDGQLFSLRYILTHLIEEYARHNGHADLLRERLDGTTGE